MASKKISYVSGGEDLLDDIQPLWEGLNRHHGAVSPHFKDEFAAYSFDDRKSKLTQKYKANKLHIDIAMGDNRPVGYIISGITDNGVGEIESIYIEDGYRSQSIGDDLMHRALAWLDKHQVQEKIVDVAVGNERVHKFYARFGFYPRQTRLKQRGNFKNDNKMSSREPIRKFKE
jgi:ribosomal protein S18 acetylase RimI-like enzyme